MAGQGRPARRSAEPAGPAPRWPGHWPGRGRAAARWARVAGKCRAAIRSGAQDLNW